MDTILGYVVTISIWAGIVIALLILIRMANVFRYIPNNQVGIVEKMWAPKGSPMIASVAKRRTVNSTCVRFMACLGSYE